jgi:hypothetical protein
MEVAGKPFIRRELGVPDDEADNPPKSRKAKQAKRTAKSVRAYAAEKQALFELAFAKMMLAAKLLDDEDPHGNATIIPNTTNLDRFVQKVLDRVQAEFVDKAEKKARELRYKRTQPKKRMGRPPKRAE